MGEAKARAKKEAEARAKAEAAEKAKQKAEQAALNGKSMAKKLDYYKDQLAKATSSADKFDF